MAQKGKNEIELLSEISQKLDKLVAIMASRDLERDDKIKMLVSSGFSNAEISNYTGIPKGTVDTVRANFSKTK